MLQTALAAQAVPLRLPAVQHDAGSDIESVWIEPPTFRPPSLHVAVPVPAWLHQAIPPRPYRSAFWLDGHWTWQRRWLWAYGLWAAPPGDAWCWVAPEYRPDGDGVWFTAGHWSLSGPARGGADASIRSARLPGNDRGGARSAPRPVSELSLRYVERTGA